MASLVSRTGSQIMVLARQKLGLMQHQMAAAVGTSVRTLSRWEGGSHYPADFHLHKVAALLHPLDPDLAREAAVAGGSTLQQLGIVKVDPSHSPGQLPAVPTRLLVDAIVCAVASSFEAEGGAPVPIARARAAVAAAFQRARDLSLGIDDVIAAVAPPQAAAEPMKRRPR